jgi:hypothetical protein
VSSNRQQVAPPCGGNLAQLTYRPNA